MPVRIALIRYNQPAGIASPQPDQKMVSYSRATSDDNSNRVGVSQ